MDDPRKRQKRLNGKEATNMAGDYNVVVVAQQLSDFCSAIAHGLAFTPTRRKDLLEGVAAPAPFTEVGVRREGEDDFYGVLWSEDGAPPSANSIAAMLSMDGAISARVGERTYPRLGMLDLITSRKGPPLPTQGATGSSHSARAIA